jgi:hypothetical protein
MTKPQNNRPPDPADHDSDHDCLPADPLRPDMPRCPCGATAGRDGVCRKCRARALFAHREIGRRRAATRRPADTRPPRHRRPTSSDEPRGEGHR